MPKMGSSNPLIEAFRQRLKRLSLNSASLRCIAALSQHPGIRRRTLAFAYLKGVGIEIGALHNPMQLPPGASVRYVDRMTRAELGNHYRRLDPEKVIDADMVDEAETLGSILDESQDFVVASHLIEHLQNPLLALGNWLRVLRHGGILYVAVPNKEKTFDRARPVTAITHLVRDFEEGPDNSRRQHYEEWVAVVGQKKEAKAIKAQANKLMERNYSIHFHVWDAPAFLEVLHYCNRHLGYSFNVLNFEVIGNEMLVILQKPSD